MSVFSIEGFLLETLAWTAALIALVLVLRRPVTRWFGPQFAYALWALPALRLIVPPIELPAWMRPASQESAPSERMAALAASPTETSTPILDPTTPIATPASASGSEVAATGLPQATTPMANVDWSSIIEPLIGPAIALWLIGAAIFLYRRFAAYFELRQELLGEGRDMGSEGAIRLIETPATQSPLAFGVIDKVVALPVGFLAQPDRRARDLALAHEIAHHKGHDLLINVLVQPLFALHWFNPLGRYGWLALRRDQEAACDARVMAAQQAQDTAQTREAYANLIVSYAAGRNPISSHALTAPMACPVLGEKSIIHRLRSLKMNDTPKSRRLAGRVMIGAAVVALPLTASISYAASEAPAAPAAPAASSAPPAPATAAALVAVPAPPAPPAPPPPPASAEAPNAPTAPEPPTAPLAPQPIQSIDPNAQASAARGAAEMRRLESHLRRMEVQLARSGQELDETERRLERRVVISRDGQNTGTMTEEEIDVMIIEIREGLEEARAQLDELPVIIRSSLEGIEDAKGRRVMVEMSCDSDSTDPTTTVENAEGTQIVKICKTRIEAQAVSGLREARDEIANDTEMDAEIRERVLRELDAQIERWERS
ncbi:MAG: M56 family metallopeptidase [Pseudomonadota bacterium]